MIDGRRLLIRLFLPRYDNEKQHRRIEEDDAKISERYKEVLPVCGVLRESGIEGRSSRLLPELGMVDFGADLSDVDLYIYIWCGI